MYVRLEVVDVLAVLGALLVVRHVVGDHDLDQLGQLGLLPLTVQLSVNLRQGHEKKVVVLKDATHLSSKRRKLHLPHSLSLFHILLCSA